MGRIVYREISIDPPLEDLGPSPLALDDLLSFSREERGTLLSLMMEVFLDHWPHIAFGPCIRGAIYELRLTAMPTDISYFDGFLRLHLQNGTGHFHLSLAPSRASDVDFDGATARGAKHCTRAAFFRGVRSGDDMPSARGLRLWNAAGLQLITVFLEPLLDNIVPKDSVTSTAPAWDALEHKYR